MLTPRAAWSSEEICKIAAQEQSSEFSIKLKQLLNNNLKPINCSLSELNSAAASSGYISALSDVRSSRLDHLILLLEHGIDPNQSDDNSGYTLLHYAADRDDINLIYLLVESGANVNVQNNYGGTPLYRTLDKYGHPETLNLLLHLGANSQIRDNSGNTVLHNLVRKSDPQIYDLEKLEILLKHGANPFSRDSNNKTALLIAQEGLNRSLKYKSYKSHENRTRRQIVALLKKYQSLWIQELDKDKDIEQITFDPPPQIPKRKLPSRVNPAIIDLTFKDDMSGIKRLIASGVNMDVIDKYGASALHRALTNKQEEIAQLLIESGADTTFRNYRGEDPLYFALHYDSNLVGLLLEKMPSDTKSSLSKNKALVKATDLETIKLLLKYGANINPSC